MKTAGKLRKLAGFSYPQGSNAEFIYLDRLSWLLLSLLSIYLEILKPHSHISGSDAECFPKCTEYQLLSAWWSFIFFCLQFVQFYPTFRCVWFITPDTIRLIICVQKSVLKGNSVSSFYKKNCTHAAECLVPSSHSLLAQLSFFLQIFQMKNQL